MPIIVKAGWATRSSLLLPFVAAALMLAPPASGSTGSMPSAHVFPSQELEARPAERLLSARKYSPFCIFGADSAKVVKKGSKRGARVQPENGECAPRRSGRVA